MRSVPRATPCVARCASIAKGIIYESNFIVSTSLKSVSSMKLHRDLGVTQKTAWFLAHRIRDALVRNGTEFAGPVEVDETYVGGRHENMSNSQRRALAGTGRGPVRMTAVVGARDRAPRRVSAQVVRSTDGETLQGFVREHAAEDATVYTDEARACATLPFNHAAVRHSWREYVRGDVHTNGIESLWNGSSQCTSGVEAGFSPAIIPVKS